MQQSLLKIIWDVALISCCRVPESTAVIIQVLNHDNIKHVCEQSSRLRPALT